MQQTKFAVNHIVECDQQTGVILQECENNSYLVDFVNGDKKRIPITEIASIPLSKKLLSIIGFSFEDSLIECSCLAPLDKMPTIEKRCCKIEVGGNALHFQIGDAEQNSHWQCPKYCVNEKTGFRYFFLYLDSVFKYKNKLVHNQPPIMNWLCPFLLNFHQ